MYLAASNFAQLEQNINKVFLDIISNSTSFSVAAITTVQTRGTTFAFIPRFRPLGGSQWEGRLYRFRLYNEFAAGCSNVDLTSGPDGGPAKTALNPNGNASCNDLYLQDADGGYVGEDDGGTFVLLDSSRRTATRGWPIKTPKRRPRPSGSRRLLTSARTISSPERRRHRAQHPGGADGRRHPSAGTSLITFNDFSSSNVATMTDYMKLSGVNSDFCVGMQSTSRHAYATEQDCGTDLMKFVEVATCCARTRRRAHPAVHPRRHLPLLAILVTPPAPASSARPGSSRNACARSTPRTSPASTRREASPPTTLVHNKLHGKS